MKADWRKSAWKALRVLVLVGIGASVTPDQVAAILPEPIRELTLGALLVGLLNFAKHQWGDRLPLLNRF